MPQKVRSGSRDAGSLSGLSENEKSPAMLRTSMLLALLPTAAAITARTPLQRRAVMLRMRQQQAVSVVRDIISEEMSYTRGDIERPLTFGTQTQLFDSTKWDDNRRTDRYYRLLVGLFAGVTTRRVLPAGLALSLFTFFVQAYDLAARANPTLPELQLPLEPFELTAPVLGLLLVFRTDSCYARYNEGIEQALKTVGRFRAVIGQLTARSVLYVGPERATCANICDQMVKVCDCALLPCHTREPARPSRWPN